VTTSGTYEFNPSLGELTLYAFNNIQIRPTQLTQEHMFSARTGSNLMLTRWANQGVNLWKVDLVTVPLVEGQATYDVDASTMTILDAYITIDDGSSPPIDRIITPVSRTEYASYPNKEQQGFTTVFWFDRLLSPTVTLWPVPDGTSAQYLKYYRVTRIEDANWAGGQTVDIPPLWMEAFADGLSYRLARAWKPEMAQGLKMVADESYLIASTQNIEQSNFYISPMINGYWRV